MTIEHIQAQRARTQHINQPNATQINATHKAQKDTEIDGSQRKSMQLIQIDDGAYTTQMRESTQRNTKKNKYMCRTQKTRSKAQINSIDPILYVL